MNENDPALSLQVAANSIQELGETPSQELALSLIHSAQIALDNCRNPNDARRIRSGLRAIETYFQRQRAQRIESNLIVAQRLRTERKIGEMLGETVENHGPKRLYRDDTVIPDGISRVESSRWQMIARIAESDFEMWVSEHLNSDELSTAAAYRVAKGLFHDVRRNENAELVEALPPDYLETGGTVSTIVLDPPWDWGDEGDVNQFGRAKPPYSTMPYEKILAYPVASFAAPNAHLYLWITNRSLPKGFALLEAWGFRYITCITWCKPSFGMGNYFRGSTEQILFGVRGSLPLLRHDAGTWFQAPRGDGGHSSKPDEFYELVETCSPAPYLELFAREERTGWLTKGAELT